ncbi:hypothetical protein [Bradyrhizobium cosmicum]|uniref:hypothetical protein n=1 Tax=Bradyrhizobium cosmicum TaxID=1404864 RepID=UPI0028ECCEC8|nr:hypothetical protein [Bradyrhizobium cosmicum]
MLTMIASNRPSANRWNAVMPIAWSGAKTKIKNASTPVSIESSQPMRCPRKRRGSLMGILIVDPNIAWR